MNIDLIRKLAKSIKFQNLYQATKEINGILLFKNSMDFTWLQQIFLSYLYFYSNLNTEVVTNKLSEKIFNNFIYEDAYMLWRREVGYDKESKDKKRDIHIAFHNKKMKFKEKDKCPQETSIIS